MTSSARVAGFLPSTNGLHFDNSWPAEPDLTIPTRLGPVSVGDASNGLCGGMAYSVRDFFESRLPVPGNPTNPVLHSPLYDYIVRRLFDSFDIPDGVAAYLAWQLPTRNQLLDAVHTEWPQVRADVDAGRLCPLGLIRVRSFWPGDLGQNHQVLVYGYDELPSGAVVLHLYDPNHHDHDDVTLAFNVNNVGAGASMTFTVGGVVSGDDHTTFGFFRTSYQHVEPPAALTLGIPRVVYAAAVNHIHEISLPGDGHWSSGQPAGPADPPTPAGNAMGYLSPASDTARVIYRSADGHIQELSLAAGSDWSVGDLSAITSAPPAGADPFGYVSPNRRGIGLAPAPTETCRVVYLGTDGHIYELCLPAGGSWSAADLSAAAGAPLAAGRPMGYVSPLDSEPRVVYRGVDGHIYELHLTLASRWEFADLGSSSGAAAAAGEPTGYVSPFDHVNRVVYRGTDGHVHELSCPPNGVWSAGDLTAITAAPASAGDPSPYVTLIDQTPRVVHLGADGHVHELSLPPGSDWSHGDLSDLSGAAPAAGDPHGYVSFLDHAARVVYRGADDHVHELSLSPGGDWFSADLTVMTAAPPALADPRGYVG